MFLNSAWSKLLAVAVHNMATAKDKLTREGAFAATNSQLPFDLQICEHVRIVARKGLEEISIKG